MNKKRKLIFNWFLVFCLVFQCCALAFAQEKAKPFLRAGIGVQGGLSVYFPQDLNEYTQDFWDDVLNQYNDWGFNDDQEIMPILFGINYNFKAFQRVMNLFQVEVWKEKFISSELRINSKFYSYGWGGFYDDIEIKEDYCFKPGYAAFGANILFVPGAHKNQVYFTLGGGIGKYQGELNYHKQGYHSINDTITNFNIIKLYKGETIGYNAVFGLTIAPFRYIEIETFVTGRFAKIPEIKDGNDVFINPFKEGKKVPLDFTGIDLRLGIKLIIP